MVYMKPSKLIDWYSNTEFVKSGIKYTIDFSYNIRGVES